MPALVLFFWGVDLRKDLAAEWELLRRGWTQATVVVHLLFSLTSLLLFAPPHSRKPLSLNKRAHCWPLAPTLRLRRGRSMLGDPTERQAKAEGWCCWGFVFLGRAHTQY